MEDLIAGSAVGGTISELQQRTLNPIKKDIRNHKTTFEDLSVRLEEIKRFNKKLDQPREDLEKLVREGESIARRHSKVRRWKYLFRRSNSKKHLNEALLKLDEALANHGIQDLVKKDGTQTTHSLQRPGINVQDLVRKNKGMQMMGLLQPPVGPDFTVGLDEPLLKLKTELLKDGEAVLVLTGLGGSGKTTLAKKLCWDHQVRDKFGGNIFFITFSRTPNLKIIVQKLFESSGYNAPEFQSDEEASNYLSLLLRRIGQNPVMLVFDDVWPGQESLVENFCIQMPDYKILVTARVAMPRFGTACHLEPLSEVDAMTLFRHFTHLDDSGSFTPKADLVQKVSFTPKAELVQKVVRSCKGSPLALKVIGNSLLHKPMEVWQLYIMRLSEGHSILDSNAVLRSCHEAILDDVETDLKECFMDLALFPEDQRIPVDVLIDMWIELYNLDDDGIRAMACIHELVARNLANINADTRPIASDNEYYYNNHFLRLHDLLRDLAIYESSREPFEQRKRLIIEISRNSQPEWWRKQKQQLVNVRTLSISTDESLFPDQCGILPTETEVLVLNLYNNKYTLPTFTRKMSKLKVLIVANYGFRLSKLNKFELLGSLINLKRIRLDRLLVPSLCKLRNLRKLSLFMCHTRQAFGSPISQISTALPNLQDLNIDYCQDLVELPSGICDITSLKKVSITNCHHFSALADEIAKLENLEVLRLRSCTDLEQIPSSIGRLERLRFLDISNCISLSILPEEIGDLDNLKKFSMTGCSRCYELPFSFANLKNLKGVICDEEMAALWKDFKLPDLQIEVPGVNLDWLLS